MHGHFVALRVAGRNLLGYLREHAPEALGRLRYVKIDTEGEIYRHLPEDERAGYHNDLRTLGYRIFKCDEHYRRGQELARTDMRLWRHFDVLAIPEELA